MKFQSYEIVLPADDATCVEQITDDKNPYFGQKLCGKPALLSAKREPSGKMQPFCTYHFGELMAGTSKLEHQILATLLADALRRDKQD
jgi:hypothetical protein